MKETILLTHDSQIEALIVQLRGAIEVAPHDIIIRKHRKQRSLSQNSALHRYCEIMAEKMTDAGIDQKDLVGRFKTGFTIPVSMEMIKDIFRTVAQAMFKKDSTADLETTEMTEVYRMVDARFGEVVGITVPWPTREPPIYGETK